MSPGAIYVAIALLLLCLTAFLMGSGEFYGDEGGKALASLVMFAFLWPLLLAMSAVMAPFYLVFLLGRWYAKKFPPSEETP